MNLLDEAAWRGKVFIGGSWAAGSAGEYPIVEPATGGELGLMGLASPGDVAEAAARAAEVQPVWAGTPHPARAAVLRRAGDLWSQHAEEVAWWNIREVGAIGPMADFALHVAEQEC